jgi:hypothetical protein
MITLSFISIMFLIGVVILIAATGYACGHVSGFNEGLKIGLKIAKGEPYDKA